MLKIQSNGILLHQSECNQLRLVLRRENGCSIVAPNSELRTSQLRHVTSLPLVEGE